MSHASAKIIYTRSVLLLQSLFGFCYPSEESQPTCWKSRSFQVNLAHPNFHNNMNLLTSYIRDLWLIFPICSRVIEREQILDALHNSPPFAGSIRHRSKNWVWNVIKDHLKQLKLGEKYNAHFMQSLFKSYACISRSWIVVDFQILGV